MSFLSISLRNLLRRPLRSSLTALGIAMAVAMFVALVGLAQGVERAWTQGLSERGVHLVCFQRNAVEILSSSLDEALVDRVSHVPGVTAAAGELINLLKIDSRLVGISGWTPGGFLWETIRLTDGRVPERGEPHGAVIGRRLADQWDIKPGARLPFQGEEIDVVGISRETLVLNESNLLLPLPLLQQIMRRPGQVTLINLRLAHSGDAAAVLDVKNRLNELFPELTFLETRDAVDASQIIQTLRKITASVSAIALLMGFFFILNTMLMSITERTRELGILSAVGWSASRIMALIVAEGMFLTVVGSVAGLTLGALVLNGLPRMKRFQGFLDPAFPPSLIAAVLVAALALGALGSLYPAWRTARMRTVEALGYE